MLGLAARYRQFGEVLEVSEDEVWGTRELGTAPVDRSSASPLFFDLLHGVAGRGIGPEAVIEAFRQLQQEVLRRSAVWLQDWYWADLLNMLGWRREVRQQTLRSLRDLSTVLAPLVIYLQVDPEVALHRALRERGAVWFNRYAGRPFDEPVTRSVVSEVAAVRSKAEAARKAEIVGWPVAFVDASAALDDVAEAAWQASSLLPGEG